MRHRDQEQERKTSLFPRLGTDPFKTLTKHRKVFEDMIGQTQCAAKSSFPPFRSKLKPFISLYFDGEMVFLMP